MREIMPFYCEYVNPARAGMIHKNTSWDYGRPRNPRASGDDPGGVGYELVRFP